MKPTDLDDGATRRFEARRTPTQSYDSIDDARFVPGTILIQRYRIVGLLGKGGMGEVYRADDLKLGQPVALKFLPDNLLSDGAALARFHREVRVARQVSHKNVCRVYDMPYWIGQATPIANTPASPILQAHLFFNRFAFQITAGLFLGFICVFLLLLFVALLRSELLSLIALGILITIMGTLISDANLIMVPFSAFSAFLVMFVLRRYGLLALCAAFFVAHLYVFFPITTELTAWYATDFTIALVICVVMAAYAAYTAMGGAKVFAEKI